METMRLFFDLMRTPVRLKVSGQDKSIPLGLIVIPILFITTILFTRSILLQDKWQTLDVNWHGYSIDHPALWSETTYGASGGRGKNLDYLSGRIGSFGGPIVLIHQTEMEHPSLTASAEWGQEIIHGREASDISSPIETQIGYGNYPAFMQSYHDGNELVKAYFVVAENRAYMIEFIRINDESQPMIDQMLASFRLIGEGE